MNADKQKHLGKRITRHNCKLALKFGDFFVEVVIVKDSVYHLIPWVVCTLTI